MAQMTKEEIFSITREQLAVELNCEAADFLKDENIVTDAVCHEKRRKFQEEPFFLQMATFGNNAVISADKKMHAWLKEWVKGKRGFWLFERELINRIQNIRKESGLEITDRISVVVSPNADVEKSLSSFAEYIKTQVLADDIKAEANGGQEVEFDDFKLNIKVEKK